ncbi:MAG: PQQ-dependent sugar dehydrogenase [Planctomycetota bacterium]|nr:PQQ-dependent sugar dehydrogenase [Planctomycetota bacterium]
MQRSVTNTGTIKILNAKTGVTNPASFLEIPVFDSGESGLLGLAFHPDYQNNGEFFIYASATGTTPGGKSQILQYNVSADPDVADSGSRTLIMEFDQPESNHNAGWIGFGPNDGYLYIATGDGGGFDDMHGAIGNGQDTDTLLGKILRIDVDGASPYAIPASNPFVGDPTALDEIWAYGLRNPWRCSFDRQTGDLFIADVGQNIWEEINFQPSTSSGGENYGWRCYEATHDFNVESHCLSISHVLPIREYQHSGGRCSITGGYRYRGCKIPFLQGEYFFGDWCTAEIFSISSVAGALDEFTNRTAELTPGGGFTIGRINSFGEDANGEIYIVDWNGQIFKIVPETQIISDTDFDCNGTVDVEDLLELLAKWGICDGCRADYDGNHAVDVEDLLRLLAEWG